MHVPLVFLPEICQNTAYNKKEFASSREKMNDLTSTIASITTWMEAHQFVSNLIILVISIILTILVTTLLSKLVHRIFKKREQKNGVSISTRYAEMIIRGVLIVIAVFWVLSSNKLTSNFGDIIFKGSAVVGAIVGFAAQPFISDLIGGLILSLSKPFQIGDRIELENGIAGIVKSISFRHVVIVYMDGREVIVPNGKLNGMSIINTSITGEQNSFVQKVNIAYGSNVKEAMEVLETLVEESPLTIPGKVTPEGKVYAPAYFLEYAESALVLAISVYYTQDHTTESVRSDINLRINEEFKKHGIEIPFNYLNVVMKEDTPNEGDASSF